MGSSIRKRLGSIVLSLALIFGLIPNDVYAATVCQNGSHTPGSTLYPADWNDQTGGYGCDYYRCTVCDVACDKDGYVEMFVGPGNGCSGGYKCHVPGALYTNACSGTFTGAFYYCKACNQVVDSDGTLADLSLLNGHTPGTQQQPANYIPCNGGCKSPFYICTVCGQPTDANGDGSVLIAGTGIHNPGSTLYPADWNDQTGGYGYDYYKCIDCGWGCDAKGHPEVFVGPENGCSGGYKCHVPGTQLHDPDYTPCGGGFKVSYYLCTACNRAVDAYGTLVPWFAPTHTSGTEVFPADYTPCNGGFKAPHYECTICHQPIDADGNPAEWSEPTGSHTPGTEEYPADYTPCNGGFQVSHYECAFCHCPVDANGIEVQYIDATGSHVLGEKHAADYTACQGGFKTEWYECEICGNPIDANGDPMEWSEPTASHKPGSEKHDANYRPCDGGFKDEFYECTFCGCPVDAYGNELNPVEGNGKHNIEKVPGKDPTYEEDGYTAFWECKDCGMAFKDAEGLIVIENIEEILLPKLEQPEKPTKKPDESQRVEISSGLQEVPEGVTNQYPSVDSVYKALVNAAAVSDANLDAENIKSVLLDVELQVQNPDGTWTAVTPEKFPAEGVEVLLPYPEGTNKDGFTFVITHMITSGSRAGKIEVLPCTLEQDGIRVRFTSMSPVVIAYQAKKADNTTEPSETKAPTENLTEVTPPQTGDAGNIVLWFAVLLFIGIGLMCLTLKKKMP